MIKNVYTIWKAAEETPNFPHKCKIEENNDANKSVFNFLYTYIYCVYYGIFF